MVDNSAGTIICYHGVTCSTSVGIENYSGKHIQADEFRHQMKFIRDNTTPLSLRELAGIINEGKVLPRRSIAITFDDSYKNVHDIALPILKDLQIPATFLISTGFIGSNRRFWTDQVEHVINMTDETEITISLKDGDMCFTLSSFLQKYDTVNTLKKIFKQLPPHERNRALDSLAKATKVEDNGDDISNYQNLTWDDVLHMDEGTLFEVGGHTVRHEILSYLSRSDLEYEIRECLRVLEKYLHHSIDLFSYPEGQRDHFNEQVISVLKEAGVQICPTAIKGFNPSGTDLFHLNRIMVGLMGERFPFPDYYTCSHA